MIIAPTAPPVNTLNEYQRRAIVTRSRRAAADKRLTAEFAERRRLFLVKLDAIVAGREMLKALPADMSAALAQLNEATGRTYTIKQDGDQYILSMPLGGEYPAVAQQAMMERLVRLQHAAAGTFRSRRLAAQTTSTKE